MEKTGEDWAVTTPLAPVGRQYYFEITQHHIRNRTVKYTGAHYDDLTKTTTFRLRDRKM